MWEVKEEVAAVIRKDQDNAKVLNLKVDLEGFVEVNWRKRKISGTSVHLTLIEQPQVNLLQRVQLKILLKDSLILKLKLEEN